MTKPARITQGQIERAMRAAKKLDVKVEIRPDGTMVIGGETPVEKRQEPVEPDRDIIL